MKKYLLAGRETKQRGPKLRLKRRSKRRAFVFIEVIVLDRQEWWRKGHRSFGLVVIMALVNIQMAQLADSIIVYDKRASGLFTFFWDVASTFQYEMRKRGLRRRSTHRRISCSMVVGRASTPTSSNPVSSWCKDSPRVARASLTFECHYHQKSAPPYKHQEHKTTDVLETILQATHPPPPAWGFSIKLLSISFLCCLNLGLIAFVYVVWLHL